jgi:serine/threonine protein kinase
LDIKLSDFGLAIVLQEENSGFLKDICGRLTHCAPEIYLGYSYTTKCVILFFFVFENNRSDVYSFGIFIWEMVNAVYLYV